MRSCDRSLVWSLKYTNEALREASGRPTHPEKVGYGGARISGGWLVVEKDSTGLDRQGSTQKEKACKRGVEWVWSVGHGERERCGGRSALDRGSRSSSKMG